ncbi:MAG TPA: SdiA-regulated domain-containing protein [Flavisolibacter sp.]
MLFQNKCLLLPLCLCCLVIGFASCKDNQVSSPQFYQFNKAQTRELGKALNEISGIAYAGNGRLLAVADSKERVFEIDLNSKKLKDYTDKVVGPDSDLEDIVMVDSTIYLLMSKGIIKEIPQRVRDTAGVKTYELELEGTNDFETLYYDPTAEGLVLLCKTCAHEKGEGIRTAFRFDLASKTFDSSAFFTISKEDIRNLLKNNDAKFDPSAAAIHPINKRLYILSSAGTLLVITDTRGKAIEAYRLNPDDFPQAEGIAFAPNGEMYISNEGKYGRPTLSIFPYQQQGKKK